MFKFFAPKAPVAFAVADGRVVHVATGVATACGKNAFDLPARSAAPTCGGCLTKAPGMADALSF